MLDCQQTSLVGGDRGVQAMLRALLTWLSSCWRRRCGIDIGTPLQAWFKHAEPHPLWGIFPRLAFEMFKDKADGWKITMKYFQNVVDTVR